MMDIRTLEGVSIETIHAAHAKVFADYVEQYDKTVDELRYMIERRGYRPELSFGAFHEGQLVSFTLNGVGHWNGALTAYDTSTGTVKEFRQQGLASRIFEESVPFLLKANIKQYLLEVIRVNTRAFDLYVKERFAVTRVFDYYIATKDGVKIDPAKLSNKFSVKVIEKPDWELFKSFWEFTPSWQNSIKSIERKRDHFVILGVFNSDTLSGYGIIEKSTGDIPQLAISEGYRKKGLATTLIYQLLQFSEAQVVRFINSEAIYLPFRKLMESIGLRPGHGQYEMIRKL